MGNNNSANLKQSTSSLSLTKESRSVHEALVRERDRKQDIEDIYHMVGEIGQGGLCKIYKIRKKDNKIGGSSRPENTKRKSFFSKSISMSPRVSHKELAKAGDRTDSQGYPLFFALKVINLTMVKEDKIDQLKNEVE